MCPFDAPQVRPYREIVVTDETLYRLSTSASHELPNAYSFTASSMQDYPPAFSDSSMRGHVVRHRRNRVVRDFGWSGHRPEGTFHDDHRGVQNRSGERENSEHQIGEQRDVRRVDDRANYQPRRNARPYGPAVRNPPADDLDDVVRETSDPSLSKESRRSQKFSARGVARSCACKADCPASTPRNKAPRDGESLTQPCRNCIQQAFAAWPHTGETLSEYDSETPSRGARGKVGKTEEHKASREYKKGIVETDLRQSGGIPGATPAVESKIRFNGLSRSQNLDSASMQVPEKEPEINGQSMRYGAGGARTQTKNRDEGLTRNHRMKDRDEKHLLSQLNSADSVNTESRGSKSRDREERREEDGGFRLEQRTTRRSVEGAGEDQAKKDRELRRKWRVRSSENLESPVGNSDERRVREDVSQGPWTNQRHSTEGERPVSKLGVVRPTNTDVLSGAATRKHVGSVTTPRNFPSRRGNEDIHPKAEMRAVGETVSSPAHVGRRQRIGRGDSFTRTRARNDRNFVRENSGQSRGRKTNQVSTGEKGNRYRVPPLWTQIRTGFNQKFRSSRA